MAKTKTKTVISDQGVVEEKDIFGKTIIVVSILMIIVLVTLGVLTVINP